MIERLNKLFGIFIVIYSTAPVFAEVIDNPCSGDGELLNITHRGSIADSPCVLPSKTAMWESGYLYQKNIPPTSYLQIFPQPTLSVGLPLDNEIAIFLPTYNRQTVFPYSGYSPTIVSFKHMIGYNQNWIIAVDSFVIPPGGSSGFGSQEVGGILNGIINYNFNQQLSLIFTLSGSSIALPSLYGGERFESINPDIVLTYAPNVKVNFFGEVYGQSKTGPGEGSGFNADYGILYLIHPTVALDLEVGHRLSGQLNGVEYYIGTGITLWFK